MFNATKFVVAGAIVALFGGFLLAGALTQPSDEVTPAAVSPAATADLLSTLDTDEVAPGVFHVLGDGHRDLSTGVWDLAVDGSGDVWVVRGAQILRLGDPESYASGDRHTGLSVDIDGSIRSDDSSDGGTFDGERWVTAEVPLSNGGTANAVQGSGFRVSGACCFYSINIHWESPDDGPFHSQVDADYRFGSPAEGALLAPVGDGTVWTTVGIPGTDTFRLSVFDGRTFEQVDTDGPDGPTSAQRGTDGEVDGQNRLVAIATAPDGTLWVSGWSRLTNELRVWSFDRSGWTEYDAVETKVSVAGLDTGPEGRDPRLGISFNADGSIWFDGLVYFDGERIAVVDLPPAMVDGSRRVGAASASPDGTVWLAMLDGLEEDCGGSQNCFDTTVGLYVITPEAVAATE